MINELKYPIITALLSPITKHTNNQFIPPCIISPPCPLYITMPPLPSLPSTTILSISAPSPPGLFQGPDQTVDTTSDGLFQGIFIPDCDILSSLQWLPGREQCPDLSWPEHWPLSDLICCLLINQELIEARLDARLVIMMACGSKPTHWNLHTEIHNSS